MKNSGLCSKSSRSPTSSSDRREEKESPRLWMMLLVRSNSALLHKDQSLHLRNLRRRCFTWHSQLHAVAQVSSMRKQVKHTFQDSGAFLTTVESAAT